MTDVLMEGVDINREFGGGKIGGFQDRMEMYTGMELFGSLLYVIKV